MVDTVFAFIYIQLNFSCLSLSLCLACLKHDSCELCLSSNQTSGCTWCNVLQRWVRQSTDSNNRVQFEPTMIYILCVLGVQMEWIDTDRSGWTTVVQRRYGWLIDSLNNFPNIKTNALIVLYMGRAKMQPVKISQGMTAPSVHISHHR